jgi:predicted Zn-dependent protease
MKQNSVWLWTALLILVWKASCFAVAGQEDAIAKGVALLRAGKVKQAEALLSSASAADPDSATLHGALGKVFFGEEKYEDAVRELGLAVQGEPDSREYNMLLSEALMGWRHFQVALDFLHAVQPRFNQYPEFHYDLGFAYYNDNKMNEAMAEFKEALRLAPNLDRAEFLLASTIAAQGDTAKSVEIFRKLTREHPSNAVYWVTLGEILGDMGEEDYPEALKACRRALALKPSDAHIQYVTATVLLKSGDLAGARPLFERLEKLGPKSLEVHVALAKIYGRMGERELARKEAATATDLQDKKTELQGQIEKRKAEFDQPIQQGQQGGGLEQH